MRVHVTPQARDDLRELAAELPDIEADFIEAVTRLERRRPLIGFDLHPLRGALQGWYAFAIGVQHAESAPRVVFYQSGHDVYIAAAGYHDEAYARARLRRAEKAGRASRRRNKADRLR